LLETVEQAEGSVEKAAEFVRHDLADYDIELRVSAETDAVLQEAHV
jgi:hypothetical protein